MYFIFFLTCNADVLFCDVLVDFGWRCRYWFTIWLARSFKNWWNTVLNMTVFWENYVPLVLPTFELFEVMVKFSFCPKWSCESLLTAFSISSLFAMLFAWHLLKTPFLTRIEKLTMGPGDWRIAVITLPMPSVAICCNGRNINFCISVLMWPSVIKDMGLAMKCAFLKDQINIDTLYINQYCV